MYYIHTKAKQIVSSLLLVLKTSLLGFLDEDVPCTHWTHWSRRYRTSLEQVGPVRQHLAAAFDPVEPSGTRGVYVHIAFSEVSQNHLLRAKGQGFWDKPAWTSQPNVLFCAKETGFRTEQHRCWCRWEEVKGVQPSFPATRVAVAVAFRFGGSKLKRKRYRTGSRNPDSCKFRPFPWKTVSGSPNCPSVRL